MKRALLLVCVAVGACGSEEPTPTPEPVSPRATLPMAEVEPRVLELAEPAAAEPVAPDAAAAVTPEVPQATIAFEIESIGQFEVVTWAEAERRAAAKIEADSFQSEMTRLRIDIANRRR